MGNFRCNESIYFRNISVSFQKDCLEVMQKIYSPINLNLNCKKNIYNFREVFQYKRLYLKEFIWRIYTKEFIQKNLSENNVKIFFFFGLQVPQTFLTKTNYVKLIYLGNLFSIFFGKISELSSFAIFTCQSFTFLVLLLSKIFKIFK